MNIIINIFLLMSFYIMVAGFTAYFKQEFNVLLFSILYPMLCATYFTFSKRVLFNNLVIEDYIKIIIIENRIKLLFFRH